MYLGSRPFIITSPRFVTRQHSPDEISLAQESFKDFKVPRMPTENEAIEVCEKKYIELFLFI